MHTSPAAGRKLTWAAPGLWAMVIVHLGSLLAFLPAARPTLSLILLAVGSYVVRCFCVTAGFHRYFSHRAFKTSRLFQFVLAFVGGMAVMRSALWWASHHRQHHKYSDKEGDPHSPREGFWWAHMLWFVSERNQEIRHELIQDFERFPELRFLDRFQWIPVLVFVGICYWIGGFAGWVWGANVSTLLLCHAVFSLNSVTHIWGRVKFEIDDDSTNFFPVAIATFGEGWHNSHHRFPGLAKIGTSVGEIDISWYGIWLLEKLRVIWGVKR